MINRGEIKIFWPFYTHSLVFNLSKVIMPFYVLYFLSIGFNFFQIAILGSIRSLMGVVLEIPTGVIADKYGKKFSVLTGYYLKTLTLFSVPFFHNFAMISIILALDAIFETFISGADKGWAVDVAESKNKSLIDNYFLKSRVFRNIGMVVAPIVAGLIASKYGMASLWPVFAIGNFVAATFLIFGKDTKTIGSKIYASVREKYNEILSNSKKAINYVISRKLFLILFLGIFTFYFIDEITSLIWTPYLNEAGVNLKTIGFLFSIISLIGIILPLIAGLLLKGKNKITVLSVCGIIYSSFLLSVASFSNTLFIIIIFVLFSSVDEIFLPIEDALTSSFTEGKNRAAILSIKSIFEAFASIIGGPVAGYLLGVFSKQQAFLLCGVLFLILPVIYFLAKKRGGQGNALPA